MDQERAAAGEAGGAGRAGRQLAFTRYCYDQYCMVYGVLGGRREVERVRARDLGGRREVERVRARVLVVERVSWPLHDIVMTNIVLWCMAYKR